MKKLTDEIRQKFGFESDSLTRKFAYFLKPENYNYLILYPPYNNLYTADITPPDDIVEQLNKINNSKQKISFYFSIPWCRYTCPYCFYSSNITSISKDDKESYLKSLLRELDLYLNHLDQANIYTIYMGGGTPGLLEYDLLKSFLDRLSSSRIGNLLEKIEEFNFEIHPLDVYQNIYTVMESFKSFGILSKLRISIGAQSFYGKVIDNIRGKHLYGAEEVKEVFNYFNCKYNIDTNLDIMWGLKGINISEELKFIKENEMFPKTFTFYQIQSPGDVYRYENYTNNIEGDILSIIDQRERIFDELPKLKFKYEPILFPSYFQKKEDEDYKNNGVAIKYNTAVLSKDNFYIGLGVSGHSKVGSITYVNTDTIEKYNELVCQNKFSIDYIGKLSDEEIEKRDNLLRMRLPNETFNCEQLNILFQHENKDQLINAFFENKSGDYKLNSTGKIFVDEIIRCAIKSDVGLMAQYDKRKINRYLTENKEENSSKKIEEILLFISNTVGEILIQKDHFIEFVANIGYTSQFLDEPKINKRPIGLLNYFGKWEEAYRQFDETSGDKLYFFSELFYSLSEISNPYPLRMEGDLFALDENGKAKKPLELCKRLSDATKTVKISKRNNEKLDKLWDKCQKAQKDGTITTFLGMINLFYWYLNELPGFSDNKNDLYFMMSKGAKNSAGAVAVALPHIDEKKAPEYFIGLKTYMNEIFALISERELEEQKTNFALQSAIAAIMSRNMSHNIGSHVLARISGDDNIGGVWANDVQLLAQYIQQRQDFIAQIATDWPEWTYPAWLMKDLMRWFLSQKHLLNYIGRSEDLEAHFYDEKTRQENPDIRFHVFRLSKGIWDKRIWSETISGHKCKDGIEVWKDVIENACHKEDVKTSANPKYTLLYTGKDVVSCFLDEDIQVAIPGGITGYHAFYTILENVIRNGAKHSFTRMKRLKENYDSGVFNNREKKASLEEKLIIAFGEKMNDFHMDVIIEYLEEEDRDHYRFRVYDNVSFVAGEDIPIEHSEYYFSFQNMQENDTRGGMNPFVQRDYDKLRDLKTWVYKETPIRYYITEKFKKNFNMDMRWDAFNPYPEKTISILFNHLAVRMNNYFRQDIITETGELKKDNWGLAEMKISSGYLLRKEITEIGAGKDNITSDSPNEFDQKTDTGDRKDDGFIIRATVSPLGTLAHEFRIPKPKEVGIVCNVKS